MIEILNRILCIHCWFNCPQLNRTIVFIGIACLIFFWRSRDICADIYKDGLITVKHEKMTIIRDGYHIKFHHPLQLSESVLARILSSVSYQEKGLLRRKGILKVFHHEEIRRLTPLIVQAFSTATPSQAIIVSSYFKRIPLTDRHNYCIMFITDHSFHIAFNRVHKFLTYNDFMSEKKGRFMTRESPVKKRRSSFWRLVPLSGQQLAPGYENWLIIDLPDK